MSQNLTDTTLLHKELTEQILGCFYEVYKHLGFGFLERVYENALARELRSRGLRVQQQVPLAVAYKGASVGNYMADLIVEDLIIIELKAAECLAPSHEIQLINYLKATSCEIGLLLNFGKVPAVRRKIFTNDRKVEVPW